MRLLGLHNVSTEHSSHCQHSESGSVQTEHEFLVSGDRRVWWGVQGVRCLSSTGREWGGLGISTPPLRPRHRSLI